MATIKVTKKDNFNALRAIVEATDVANKSALLNFILSWNSLPKRQIPQSLSPLRHRRKMIPLRPLFWQPLQSLTRL